MYMFIPFLKKSCLTIFLPLIYLYKYNNLKNVWKFLTYTTYIMLRCSCKLQWMLRYFVFIFALGDADSNLAVSVIKLSDVIYHWLKKSVENRFNTCRSLSTASQNYAVWSTLLSVTFDNTKSISNIFKSSFSPAWSHPIMGEIFCQDPLRSMLEKTVA